MKNKIRHQWQKNLFQRLKNLSISPKLVFFILGIASIAWFLIRVIPKPQRAGYPCMKATAPFASSFILYIIAISGGMFGLKKFYAYMKEARFIPALAFLVVAMFLAFAGMTVKQNKVSAKIKASTLEDPNSPMGEAKGIFPGRVVWVYEPDATNEDINNDYKSNHSDSYFSDLNTSQTIVDEMVKQGILDLTEEANISGAWSSIFKYHNQQRGKGEIDYVAGEIVFIKINATSTWGGNYSTSNLSRRDNNNYAISETSPQLVTTVLRHLVNVVGVAEDDIYLGDPMKHIYKDIYEKWHDEFPNVHYLDTEGYTDLGREKAVKSSSAEIDYSDRGEVLREGDWSSALTGDPIYTDNLYQIFEDMEYMINLPTLKGHKHAGVTMFAKNHFGSHTRGDAKHLHGGLVKMGDDPIRNEYGMYRVQVDILGHKLLGEKNLIYLMDALYCSEMEVNQPDKFMKAPWNGDWTSSVFVSQDPIAIESVGFDMLAYEFDGSNGLDAFPHYGAVDDYLHQAASSENWAEGISYDPENDGVVIASLGVHEHWNNSTDMEYSRNLEIGEGIELVKVELPQLDIPVTKINVSADVDSVETSKTLQLLAEVLPFDATNQTVSWSVTGFEQASATIDESGLLTGVSPGNVTVSAIANDGSSIAGTFGVKVYQPVGILEDEGMSINLFPNPTSHTLNIITNNIDAEYTVYSISGKLVYQGTSNGTASIDVSEYENGVYIINISTGGMNNVSRFIKE